MNKAVVILAILLFAWPAQAGVIMRGSGGTPPVCTTPANGNTMNEGFEGGYEVGLCGFAPCWTETGFGGTLTEDYSCTGSPPTGSCTKCLYSTSNAQPMASVWNYGSTIPRASNDIDITFTFQVKSWTLAAGGILTILQYSQSADVWVGGIARVDLYSPDGATLQIRGRGTNSATNVTLSVDTWYTAKLHVDGAVTSNSYFRIDAGTTCDTDSECKFTRYDASDGRYVHAGVGYGTGSGETAAIELGAIWVNVTAL